MEAFITTRSILGASEKFLTVLVYEKNKLETKRDEHICLGLEDRIFRSVDEFRNNKRVPSYYSNPKKKNPKHTKFIGFLQRNLPYNWSPNIDETVVDFDAIQKENKNRFRDEWKLIKKFIQGDSSYENIRDGYYFNSIYSDYLRTIVDGIDKVNSSIPSIKKIIEKVKLLREINSYEVSLNDEEISKLEHISDRVKEIEEN